MAPTNSPPFIPASGVYFTGAYTSMISSLSVYEKQKILHRVAQGLDGGPEILESWTRKDLLQLICLEMGKERKYTGVSKGKMIKHLMKLVATKGLTAERVITHGFTSVNPYIVPQSSYRRQRKVGRPARVQASIEIPTSIDDGQTTEISWVCRNTACKARLLEGANFCQRCSCCLCRNFDDNKDPSLWLVCTPEPDHGDMDCRLSCHVECALKKGIAGVVFEGSAILLDGSYRCYACGKVSSLIGCLKKQLLVAREARRVDTLCQRLSLCHRLLNGTKKHKELDDIVKRAIEKLEEEVGPIIEGSAKFARGLVNRLSSSGEVLQLISSALTEVDIFREDIELNYLPRAKDKTHGYGATDDGGVNGADANENDDYDEEEDLCTINFNKVSSSSISLRVQGGGEPVYGYRIWHRRTTDDNFPTNPTCIISANPGEAQISNLEPCTEYDLRVIPFFDRGIGEPVEASCCTRTEISREFSSNSDEWYHPANVDEDLCVGIDKPQSNFKVRDLGKVLHSAWGKPSEVVEGIFSGKGWGVNTHNKTGRSKERESDTNVLLSSISNMSDDGEEKEGEDDDDVCIASSEDKAGVAGLNVSENRDLAVEESRASLDAEEEARGTSARRDSTEVLQESDEARDANAGQELDDTSGPGNSQISQAEVAGIIVSNALRESTRKLRDEGTRARHEEEHDRGVKKWAMQVRGSGRGAEMEEQPMSRKKKAAKKTFDGDSSNDEDGDGDNNYGIIDGCSRGGGSSLCASRNYELCVKIVRWLECQGLVKEEFRMKFLTWFSLRASEHERRIVSVFIDTLQDNPASLAEQLVDTFSEIISSKRHHHHHQQQQQQQHQQNHNHNPHQNHNHNHHNHHQMMSRGFRSKMWY